MTQNLYNEIKYGTNIIPEEEYIETIMAISDVASEMVVKTLGPFGKTTMLHQGSITYPTKDGWSVLNMLQFNDSVLNVLYSVLKQISFDMVSTVGDNTTGGFVGSNIFMHLIMDFLNENSNVRQADIISIIKEVGEEICNSLEKSKYVKHVDIHGNFEELHKVALIASNQNKELADIIQKIYQETDNPNIYVTMDPSKELDYEIQKGYKLDCNPIMQKCYINTDDRTYVESNPSTIMIFDHNVNYQEHNQIISAISKYSSMINEQTVILAPHYDDVLSNIIGSSIDSMLQQKKVPNILLIQVPLTNSIQRAYLSDLVLLTNAQVIDYGKVRAFNAMVHNQTHPDDKIEDALLNTDQYRFETTQDLIASCAGHARKFVVGQKYFIIQDYESIINKKLYQQTLLEVKDTYLRAKRYADESSSPLLKEYMDAYQHYTKLNGNIGVIKVGGANDLERKCLKDTVDDAVLACRSAYEHGYVPGLNLALLWVIFKEPKPWCNTKLKNDVLHIFEKTFSELSLKVFKNINPNEDADHRVICDNEEEWMTAPQILSRCIDNEEVYNIVDETIMPADESTVINSVKSDVEMIHAIVSILSVILTSNQFLTLNRTFDRSIGAEKKIELNREIKAADYAAIADSIMDKVEDRLPNISLFGLNNKVSR